MPMHRVAFLKGCVVTTLVMASPYAFGQFVEHTLVSETPGFVYQFGIALDFDGQRAIVGEQLSGAVASNAGAAAIWARSPLGVWTREATLLPAELDADDTFGAAVAIDGDTAVVTAPDDDDAGQNTGAVYVYRRDAGGAWQLEAKLLQPNPTDFYKFGFSVDIDGDVIVTGGTFLESAFVFRRDPILGWQFEAELTASDAAAGNTLDYFGAAVSIQGDVIAVGARFGDRVHIDQGATYIFRRDAAGDWIEEAIIDLGSIGFLPDYFGSAVDLDADLLAVSAYGDDSIGAVHLYRNTAGSTWQPVAKLSPSQVATFIFFGSDIALSGSRLVVGASLASGLFPGDGAVYIFEDDGAGVWSETARALPPGGDRSGGVLLGAKVALVGDVLLAGATSTTVDGFLSAGAAIAFQLSISLDDLTGDCNGNGAPDLFDIIFSGVSSDCNDNGIPDECDIASGFSADLNGDGIPDECQDANDCLVDFNGDGVLDFFDVSIFLQLYSSGCP